MKVTLPIAWRFSARTACNFDDIYQADLWLTLAQHNANTGLHRPFLQRRCGTRSLPTG